MLLKHRVYRRLLIPETALVLATWNVNSLRARLEHVLRYWDRRRPDVLCLQEIKVEDDAFPREPFEERGIRVAVAGQKGYHGVAVLSRLPLADPVVGFPHLSDDHPLNRERRLLAVTVEGLRVISVYAPNGEAVGSEKFGYKLAFFEALREYLDREFTPGDELVLAGDFNVAPEPQDVYDPASWEGRVLFSQPEREALRRLREFGLEDCLRRLHPGEEMYTWWDYRGGAFWKNQGLRIDHVLATPPVADRCTQAGVDLSPRRWKRPSDHAPVWVAFGEGA
ncbi:exodeoxyribonuclease III [Deferrisoma palaeochoriense]